MWSLYLFAVILVLVHWSACQVKQQEGAKVNVCNTKYFTDCYAITRRAHRGEPYTTTLTTNSKYMSDNNITLKVILDAGMPVEIINVKGCEMQSIKWAWEYIQTYSNIGECPHNPGVYGIYNLKFPPKNMPQAMKNLFKGKIHAKFMLIVTKTGEVMADFSVVVYS